MTATLPKFDNPPVAETVLSVTYKPLGSWRIPHIGLFWSRVRDRYPECAIQPPLPDEIEKFGGDEAREITLTIGPTNVRAWFTGDTGWLLQVQNSKFISNWRDQPGAGHYPNYDGFRSQFDEEWRSFTSFLTDENIGPLELLQAEVLYVNHIDIDGGEPPHLEKIFPMWSQITNAKLLSEPQGVQIKTVFPIEEDRGRLYIAVEPVVRHTDLKQAIQMSLTARTVIASNENDALFEALDLAHKWVVQGFADFTTEEMHEVWKRKQ